MANQWALGHCVVVTRCVYSCISDRRLNGLRFISLLLLLKYKTASSVSQRCGLGCQPRTEVFQGRGGGVGLEGGFSLSLLRRFRGLVSYCCYAKLTNTPGEHLLQWSTDDTEGRSVYSCISLLGPCECVCSLFQF